MAEQHQIYVVKIPFKIYINKNKKMSKRGGVADHLKWGE